MEMKLHKIKKIEGKIKVITGLRIGGSVETMEIGGIDMPLVRISVKDKETEKNLPYIPGSSLKGRMRSLIEWATGNLSSDERKPVHQCKNKESFLKCEVCRVFGISADQQLDVGPTRLLVRDSYLSAEWYEAVRNGKDITEVKVENNINRITAKATPRSIERVVPGVTFDLDIAYRVLDTGDGGAIDEKYFQDVVLKALALVEKDYLGGCGSRGCGKVKFIDLKDEAGNSLTLPTV